MSLVPSLLQAIVSVDGEVLVMHASERPYVVSASGQVELARGGLTLDAVGRILIELLPSELQQTLEDVGAVQYNLPPQAGFPREQFTVIAARGGDDIWAEIRRRRVPDDDRGPDTFFAVPQGAPSGLAIHGAIATFSSEPDRSVVDRLEVDWLPEAFATPPAPVTISSFAAVALGTNKEPIERISMLREAEHESAVVIPMSRAAMRAEVVSTPAPEDVRLGLERLVRAAVARDASRLYLLSDARPSIRVDGKLLFLDGESVLTPGRVMSLLKALLPGRDREALGAGAITDWVCDVPEIGRVGCRTFSDHRGPGAVLRFMPHTLSAEQLALPPEIQALAMEREGLVLVAGLRSSGKRTLMSAFVDLINRTRCDHVITIGRDIGIVHASSKAIISQREVHGGDEALVAAARAALGEDPDVLVIDVIRRSALMDVALDAAASGSLVIAGLSAHNATESIERAIKLYPPEYALHVRLALADHLRGVVAQILLPRIGGGRVAVREVLLNTPAMSGVIAKGETSQLSEAIDGEKCQGMVPLNDALLACVQSRTVDIHEALRHVSDVPAFLTLLERHGIDTSSIERR